MFLNVFRNFFRKSVWQPRGWSLVDAQSVALWSFPSHPSMTLHDTCTLMQVIWNMFFKVYYGHSSPWMAGMSLLHMPQIAAARQWFQVSRKFALSFVVFVYLCVSGRRVLSEVRRTPAHDYLRTNAHYVETIGMKPILWEGLQQGFCFLIRLKTHKTFWVSPLAIQILQKIHWRILSGVLFLALHLPQIQAFNFFLGVPRVPNIYIWYISDTYDVYKYL